jgi:hypothetical protein
LPWFDFSDNEEYFLDTSADILFSDNLMEDEILSFNKLSNLPISVYSKYINLKNKEPLNTNLLKK